jgi:hypothetical protein
MTTILDKKTGPNLQKNWGISANAVLERQKSKSPADCRAFCYAWIL